MGPNPYAFVVGCSRSGTTLLQRMLNAHPDLAVIHETHFITRALGKRLTGGDRPLTDELVDRVRTYHRFPRLGLADADIDAAAAKGGTYGEFVSRIFDLLAAQKGKRLAGDKTPDYVRHLPLLHDLFPWNRTVHIIRDGRDVALSVLEWGAPGKGPGGWALFATEPVATCALWWRWTVGMGRADGAALARERYHEVRYEDVVDDSEAALRPVVDFLGLAWMPEVLAFHEGRTRSEPGLSAKAAWLPPTPGLRNWRSSMTGRDLELFEALAGDLLGDLGYEVTHTSVSPAVAEVADRCRAWWAGELARKQAKAGPPT